MQSLNQQNQWKKLSKSSGNITDDIPDLEGEIWKPCADEEFQDYYMVSNKGRVKSLDRYFWNRFKYCLRKGRLMKTHLDTYGYERVCLHTTECDKHMQVHRLVAQAFIPNPNNYPQVNHIDCDKTNNCVENLEWCTAKENVQHAYKNNLVDFSSMEIPVVQVDIKTSTVLNKYKSMQEAHRQTNISTTAIMNCCKNKAETAKGYRWTYDNSFNIGDYVELSPIFRKSTRKRSVAQIKDNKIIAIYNTIMDASRATNCCDSAIGMCCKGKANQHHGFKWQYATPDMKVGDVINL